MSKIMTPAIERQMKINKKRPVGYIASPFKEAWRRLARNKTAVAGLVVIAIFIIVAIIAPLITRYDPNAQDYSATLQPPNADHIFGTDNYGRDIFARIVYGARVSLPIGLLCAICSLITGGLIGVVAAYFGGLFEDIIMRLCDIIQAIPPMLLAIAVLAALGNGIDKMIIANTIALIPLYARISRASIYTVKENDYIEADVQAYAPQCPGTDHRNHDLWCGRMHSGRFLPQLSGSGHYSSDSGMGSYAFQCKGIPDNCPVLHHYSGHYDHDHSLCDQSVWRRIARCIGSETEIREVNDRGTE